MNIFGILLNNIYKFFNFDIILEKDILANYHEDDKNIESLKEFKQHNSEINKIHNYYNTFY